MRKIALHELFDEVFLDKAVLAKPYIADRTININQEENISLFIKKCISETKNAKISGAHRKNDWAEGWSGSGVYYSELAYNNLPYYFYKNTHVRCGTKVYKDESGFVEYDLLRALQAISFYEFIGSSSDATIFEFGCGTGSNIQFLSTIYPLATFFGSDWVQTAITKLIENQIVPRGNAKLVDYFNNSTFPQMDENYIAFTNASLEQAGENYHEFMNFLIEDPRCLKGIHIEPVREIMDLRNPLNVQSYFYAEKRNYLTKFIDFLNSKNLKLIQQQDYGIGSKYISGYQVVTWSKSLE